MKKYLLLSAVFCCATALVFAEIPTIGNKKNLPNVILGGTPAKITAFDQTSSTKSNVEFYITNYGMVGADNVAGLSGLQWPRDSKNYYLYGGGLWFGAVKTVDSVPTKLCAISYNPNSGNSFFQPSKFSTESDSVSLQQTRVFRSTDFNNDGTPTKSNFSTNWLVWDTDPSSTLFSDGYTGIVVTDPQKRNKANYPKGAAFVSDEDIVTVFDDQDLSRYEGGVETRKKQGYPLNIQVTQRIYSWSTEQLKDAIVIEQKVVNIGNDTLFNCALAPVFDFDITFDNGMNLGANDNSRYLNEDSTLKLSVMWTDTSAMEKGRGFGYMGIGFIRTPSVDNLGFLLPNNDQRDRSQQIGTKSIKYWTTAVEPIDNEQRYNFITNGTIDAFDGQSSDKRFMMSTSGINLRPNDTATIAYVICFAKPSVNSEADGSWNDVQGAVNVFKRARTFYDATFDKKILGVETGEKDNNALRVYPNPSSSYLLLQSELSSETFHLYNVLGEIVRTVKTDDKGSCAVNIQDLSNGVYFCRNTTKNTSNTVQVVIAR